MDSLVCCKMFPERHKMDDECVAYVLEQSYQGCVGMTGQDVVELYSFMLAQPELPGNPVGYWLNIFNRPLGPDQDMHLVELAIIKFARRSRPRRVVAHEASGLSSVIELNVKRNSFFKYQFLESATDLKTSSNLTFYSLGH